MDLLYQDQRYNALILPLRCSFFLLLVLLDMCTCSFDLFARIARIRTANPDGVLVSRGKNNITVFLDVFNNSPYSSNAISALIAGANDFGVPLVLQVALTSPTGDPFVARLPLAVESSFFNASIKHPYPLPVPRPTPISFFSSSTSGISGDSALFSGVSYDGLDNIISALTGGQLGIKLKFGLYNPLNFAISIDRLKVDLAMVSLVWLRCLAAFRLLPSSSILHILFLIE